MPPYREGWLINPAAAEQKFLPTASAITVQKVHGTVESIAKIRKKYPTADLESMEGAAVHYAALITGTPFFQIRSISNLIELRNPIFTKRLPSPAYPHNPPHERSKPYK